jgi:hypothetical protein
MADKQKILRICENRVIKREDLIKPGFFVKSSFRFEAFYYLRRYLQDIKPFGRDYYLPIDERFAMPVSPYKYYTDAEIKDLTDQDKVADESGSLSSLETAATQRKNRFADFMGIAVMGAVALLIIVILLVVSGKINLRMFTGGT